jgi:hypothetical protein
MERLMTVGYWHLGMSQKAMPGGIVGLHKHTHTHVLSLYTKTTEKGVRNFIEAS